MNEQWRWRIHNAKKRITEHTQPYINHYIPADMRREFNEWRAKKRFDKLDFNDYTDDIGVSIKEFNTSRESLVSHIGQVLNGRGGKSQQEADKNTAAWVDNLGQHFAVVASLVSGGEGIHPVHGTKNLAGFMIEDETLRTAALEKLVPYKVHIPQAEDQNLKLFNIIYSFADPEKEWATEPAIINLVQPMERDEAVEVYKQIVKHQTDWMLQYRRPNIHETGGSTDILKTAALSVGAVAVLSMLFGSKRKY